LNKRITVLKKIILIVLLTTIIGCSKKEKNYKVKIENGVKVFHNTTKPSDPNFSIKPKELFTIQGFNEDNRDSLRNFSFLMELIADKGGDIYIADSKLCEVKRFNKNGDFISSFVNKGNGPGEMQNLDNIMLFNNIFYLSDGITKKNLKFDKNENFLSDFVLDHNTSLFITLPLSEDKFIAVSLKWRQEKDGNYFEFDYHIRNSKFENILNLQKNGGKYLGSNTDLRSFMSPICVGNNYLYIAKTSEYEYKIDVYNFDGILQYTIKKNYARILMSNKELQIYEKSRFVASHGQKKNNYKIKHKKAINIKSMFVDKNGYLLVQASVERNEKNKYDFIVDAFKDGLFINRFKMDVGPGYDFYNSNHRRYFIDNRIYHQNREDNNVTVFEY